MRAAAWLGVGLLLIGGAAFKRQQLASAWSEMRLISGVAMVLLAVVFVLHRLMQAAFMASSVEGLPLRRAVLANEAHTGCTNATIGGSAIGTGVKAAMLRSWQVEPAAIAASVTATAVFATIAMWAFAVAFALPMVLQGAADRGELAIALVGSVAVIGPLCFWWAVLRSPRVLGSMAAVATLLQQPLERRFPRSRPVRMLARLDVAAEAERLRTAGSGLLARQGLSLAAAALASQVALALVLVSALRALGVSGDVASSFDIIRAFALARVLGALSPLPGGVGLLDAGLAASLTRIGVPGSTAIAAIAVFRALTFALPLITGALAVTYWRRVDRRAKQPKVTPLIVPRRHRSEVLAA